MKNNDEEDDQDDALVLSTLSQTQRLLGLNLELDESLREGTLAISSARMMNRGSAIVLSSLGIPEFVPCTVAVTGEKEGEGEEKICVDMVKREEFLNQMWGIPMMGRNKDIKEVIRAFEKAVRISIELAEIRRNQMEQAMRQQQQQKEEKQ
jgi:hypothetical protein